jgi:hypothetical protein
VDLPGNSLLPRFASETTFATLDSFGLTINPKNVFRFFAGIGVGDFLYYAVLVLYEDCSATLLHLSFVVFWEAKKAALGLKG